MNQVVLIGRLARDCDTRNSQGGTEVTHFTLAVNRPYSKNNDGQTADFIRCVCFGKTAENCARYLSKGSQAAVQGRIQTGSYKKPDGTMVYTTDIIADRVEFLGSKKQQSTSQGSIPAYGAPTQSAPKTQQTSVDIGDGGAPVEGFAMIDESDIPF